MPRKPIDLPPDVAHAFVRDMHAFFKAGGTGVRADGIAAQRLHALKQHYSGKLKLHDVKTLFVQMRDQVSSLTASEGGWVKNSNRAPR
jgi:hypothetical protein